MIQQFVRADNARSGVLVAIAALGRSRGAACSDERDDRPDRFESALVDLSRIFYYAEGRVRYAALRDELRVAADERALDLAVPRLSLFRSLERAVASGPSSRGPMKEVGVVRIAARRPPSWPSRSNARPPRNSAWGIPRMRSGRWA
jgi:hypothetical protein